MTLPNCFLLLGQLAMPILVLILKLESSRAVLRLFKADCAFQLKLARFPACLEASQTLRVDPVSLALTCRSLFTSLIDLLLIECITAARSVSSMTRSQLRFSWSRNAPIVRHIAYGALQRLLRHIVFTPLVGHHSRQCRVLRSFIRQLSLARHCRVGPRHTPRVKFLK